MVLSRRTVFLLVFTAILSAAVLVPFQQAEGMYSRLNLIHGKIAQQNKHMLELGSSYLIFVTLPVSLNYYYGINDRLTVGAGVTAELWIFPSIFPVSLTPFINWSVFSSQGWVPGITLSLELDNTYNQTGTFSVLPGLYLNWEINQGINPYIGFVGNIAGQTNETFYKDNSISVVFGDQIRMENGSSWDLAITWLAVNKAYPLNSLLITFGLGVFTIDVSYRFLL